MKTQVQLAERMVRFMALLPHDKESDLIILKGHLLIEEVLTEISQLSIAKSTNPIELKVNQGSKFHQKLLISWCLNRGELTDSIWSSLKELKQIRNKMAHKVEPIGIDNEISKFTASVLNETPFEENEYKGKELAFSISWLFISVSQFLYECKNENHYEGRT